MLIRPVSSCIAHAPTSTRTDSRLIARARRAGRRPLEQLRVDRPELDQQQRDRGEPGGHVHALGHPVQPGRRRRPGEPARRVLEQVADQPGEEADQERERRARRRCGRPAARSAAGWRRRRAGTGRGAGPPAAIGQPGAEQPVQARWSSRDPGQDGRSTTAPRCGWPAGTRAATETRVGEVVDVGERGQVQHGQPGRRPGPPGCSSAVSSRDIGHAARARRPASAECSPSAHQPPSGRGAEHRRPRARRRPAGPGTPASSSGVTCGVSIPISRVGGRGPGRPWPRRTPRASRVPRSPVDLGDDDAAGQVELARGAVEGHDPRRSTAVAADGVEGVADRRRRDRGGLLGRARRGEPGLAASGHRRLGDDQQLCVSSRQHRPHVADRAEGAEHACRSPWTSCPRRAGRSRRRPRRSASRRRPRG